MSRQKRTRLMTAALLALMPILGLSQHGGMGGSGGMPSGGSMPRPTGGSGMSDGMGTRMEPGAGMSGRREERRMHAEALQHGHRDLLDFDPHGNLIVRNEIVGFGATPRELAAVQAAGFVISRQSELKGLDANVVVLAAPQGMSARRALKKLREIDPVSAYDFNHVYFEGGADTGAASAAAIVPSSRPAGDGQSPARRVGLVDGGVEPTHAALRSFSLHMHGCNGTAVPSAHGTAIASRLVAGFKDVAPTSTDVNLYVADVYCGAPTGGSIDAVMQGLAWLMQEDVPVINVSLVGPPNVLLQRVVEMASARGHLIVAAVGNDGPSAPPLYPAAYPGVVAVTGVDRADKVLIEAGRGKFIAFAAPGADIDAASLPSGYSPVRGTSFAAPIVASRLALRLERPDRVAAERAVSELATAAVDLGRPGRDPVYGNGCVGCAARNAAAGAGQTH
jgi:subtilisin family serine protease